MFVESCLFNERIYLLFSNIKIEKNLRLTFRFFLINFYFADVTFFFVVF